MWGKLFSNALIQKYKIRFDENMVFSEDRVFNINYYKHIERYAIADRSEYVYVAGNDGLSHERSLAAFGSELKKLEIEKNFIYQQHVKNADVIFGEAIVNILALFVSLKSYHNSYRDFYGRVEAIKKKTEAKYNAKSLKHKLVLFCYRHDLIYPIYWYYKRKIIQ